MLKRQITFEDFDGNAVTETHYFNLMKTELLKLEIGEEGGSLHDSLVRIIEAEDRSGLINEFQRIILASYGQRSDDGKKFLKSDAIRQEFEQSPAFDSLFMELVQDDKKAASFVMGIMPRDMAAAVEAQQPQDKPSGLPPVPRPPTPPTQ